MSTSKIFFSYSRMDSVFALRLAKDIRGAGVDIWMDQLDIPAGSRWDVEVENALANASCFLLILSPFSQASENVQDEIAYALDAGKIIIPVILENCTIHFRLRRLKRVDFTKNYEEGLAQLLAAFEQPVFVY
jgi:hypothetical protein